MNIRITDGKVQDVNMLDEISPEAEAFFVVPTKQNVVLQRRYSRPVDKSVGLRSDHTVILTAIESVKAYPDAMRRVRYFDAETNQRLGFLTNNFSLPAIKIAQIYKCRWQVELLFKWIKQHLGIKAFFGTSENAVKTQIWIAVSVYVLVAIVRKRMGLDSSLYQILTDSQPDTF
jgi:IS4 transposase